MPKASAPSAPWVAVCESPHTIVSPGSVRPCSGPTTWTMPWRGSPGPRSGIPHSPAFRDSSSTLPRISSAAGPLAPGAVGT